MVVDTSALLAVYFDEPMAAWVATELKKQNRNLLMSTANYTEAMILVLDRRPAMLEDFQLFLHDARIRLMPLSSHQAELAAQARKRYPLNLGDCFAYALAKEEACPLLTLDGDFRSTDIAVVLPERYSKQ